MLFVFILLQLNLNASNIEGNKLDKKELTFYIHQISDTLTNWIYDEYLSEKRQEELTDNLQDFYRLRNYKSLWVDEEREILTNLACNLLDKLEQADEEGLLVSNYRVPAMRNLQEKIFGIGIEQEEAAKFEIQLSQAYLTYMEHLSKGQFEPAEIDTAFIFEKRKIDVFKHLQQTINSGDINSTVNELSPKIPDYKHLKTTLLYYNKIKNDTNLLELPMDLVLKEGEKHEAVPTIATYLTATGDLSTKYWRSSMSKKQLKETSNKQFNSQKDTSIEVNKTVATKDTANRAVREKGLSENLNSHTFTKEMVDALKNFQKRNKLNTDGIIGPNTLQIMNVPVEKRITQIKLNMERMRWLPENLGEKYVWVNIPAFQLYFVENEKVTLDMKVVVGESYNPTPAFKDKIDHIVFSPTWTPTPEIAKNDLLPKIKKNPNYFKEKNMVIYEDWSRNAKKLDPKKIKWTKISADNFPFKLVQQPGVDNSLGRVKFMFPNEMDIYLHDTPAKALFSENQRDASHGCVRVEDPNALTVKLLAKNEGNWTEEKVAEYMNKTETDVENLVEAVPVFLVYFTTWADQDAIIHFEEDVYKFDEKQLAIVEK
ncbi:MAG: L,D-transpeptidase family protein [Chitinophagales bacterium]